MAERIFVTGGAGFVGSSLVDRLVEGEGFQVTVYDNLSSGRKEFIAQHLKKPNFRFVKADLLDAKKLSESMRGHDLVFHLAANPDIRAGIENPEVDLKQGTVATFNVLEAMRKNDVKKIAFSSSSVVYGEPKVFPTPEDYGPLQPISVYGASKLASEGLITAYSHTFDLQSWVYRFANIIGRRGTHGILVDFKEKLKTNRGELEVLGDGTQRKSYLLVDECADAMLYCFAHSKKQVNVFNLGCGDQITVSRIAEIFLEEAGLKNTKLRYTGGNRGWRGDVPEMFLDVSRLNALGWKAKHTSEEAVRKAVKELMLKCRP